MKKIASITLVLSIFSIAAIEQPSSQKNKMTFTRKDGYYPLASPIKKISHNIFKLAIPNDANVYAKMQIIGTTKQGISIVNVEIPNENPLTDPVFGILGEHNGQLYLIELKPEYNHSSLGKNIDHLYILSLQRPILKSMSRIVAIPIMAFALFGGYKAACDILHWYKERHKK